MKNPAAKYRLRLRRTAFAVFALTVAALAAAAFSLRWRGEGQEQMNFKPAPEQVFAVFGNSFAVCSSTQLQVFDKNGRSVLTQAVSAPEPGLAASDTALAVWSAGSPGLTVVGPEGEAESLETSGGVLAVSANALGMFAVVTDDPDYLGLVTVYDAALEPVYRWYAATAWPIAAALSPGGDMLAVLAASEEGGQLRLFSLASEAEQARFTAPDEVFFELGWLDGGLCLISGGRAVFLDAQGTQTGEYAFGSLRLADYGFGGDFAVLALADSGRTRLVSLDGSGKVLGSLDTERALVQLDAENGKIAALYSDGAAVYNRNLTERGKGAEAAGAQALLLRGDGETIAVFPGAAKPGLV